MVVTRKQVTNNNPPAAPSRSNSNTTSSKAAKRATTSKGASHLRESHVEPVSKPVEAAHPPQNPTIRAPDATGPFSDNPTFLPSPKKKTEALKVKGKGKSQKKDKKRAKQSASLFDALSRIALILLMIYSVMVCPNDDKLESPVCKSIVYGRVHFLEPYLFRPIQTAVHHPAIAPYVEHVQPYVEQAKPYINQAIEFTTVQSQALYSKAEIASRPYVLQAKREYRLRIRPHFKIMEYNIQRYKRQAQPYVNQLQPYINDAEEVALKTWIKAEPYVFLVLSKIYELPALTAHFVVRPLEDARKTWVDPQWRKIMEKVEELSSNTAITENATSASVPASTVSEAPAAAAPSPEPLMEPTEEDDTEEENQFFLEDPQPGATPEEEEEPLVDINDEDLDAFLNEYLTETPAPEPTTTTEQPVQTQLSEEEKAEKARIRKEENAKKRADVVERHKEWEKKVEDLAKETKQDLIDMLVKGRTSAYEDLTDPARFAQKGLASLRDESAKAVKNTEGYLSKLLKDDARGTEKVSLWEKVLEKVEAKFGEKVSTFQAQVAEWMNTWASGERNMIEVASKRVEDLAGRAQSDLGLDYSWLDDVGTRDWKRYHELKRSARRHKESYYAIWNGTHVEAPANLVDEELIKIQTTAQGIISDFYKSLSNLRQKATKAFAASDKAPPSVAEDTPEPEFSILPIDPNERGEEEPPVLAGGIPADKIIIGRGAEEVAEAIERAEALHQEL